MTATTRLTLTQAATYLGLARQTLYQWRWEADGTKPPSYRIGNRVYYDLEDLDAWIAGHKARTLK